MKKMRVPKWTNLVVWPFFVALVLFLATPQQVNPAGETLLRLHVRANSDSPADQALKYEVRDAVLDVLYGRMETAGSAAAAQREVEQMMPLLVAAAQETVYASGYAYTVRASLGEAEFPTRLYGDRVYRAGRYQALQIFLGEGSGENWWCVLFPPLCFVEAAPDRAIPVVQQPGELPQPRSRLLEWLRKLFAPEA
jgi:stage II sporulation protein R